MKNWNKTGKIKAIILALLFFPNLLAPIGAQPQGVSIALAILMPLIFGSIALPFIVKINSAIFRQVIAKPNWNDNPLTLKQPLTFFHFGAYFFLTVGLSILMGTGIKFQTFSIFGIISISFGIGILIGIWLALKWTKKK